MKFLFLLVLISCTKPNTSDRGENLYKTKCISCHNANPSKPGALGPEIAGSSFELIKSKTQNKQYPPGYVPKRKTNVMPKIPLENKDIEDIQKYIQTFRTE